MTSEKRCKNVCPLIKSQITLFQLNESLILLCFGRQKRQVLANLLCLISVSLFLHEFTFVARQVLIQTLRLGVRLGSSRARSKRVINQSMFDIPAPLVVHVLAPHT